MSEPWVVRGRVITHIDPSSTAPCWEFEVAFPLYSRGPRAGRPIMPITGNSRVPWQARSQRHRRIRDHVAALLLMDRYRRHIPVVEGRVRVETVLRRGPGQRILDHDQAVAIVKPCIDGLVDARLAVDDSPRWMDRDIPEQARSTVAGVKFRVFPL